MAMHSREHLNAGDAVIIDCTHQCNVMVMDDANYHRYRRGDRVQFYGGGYRRLPAVIGVPSSGYWNVVLEAPAGARYGMRLRRR